MDSESLPFDALDTAQTGRMSADGITEARSASDSTIEMGGQAIEAMGNDLAAAASGHLRGVDMENARLRLRDVQTALLSLGYSLDDDEDPVEHIEKGDSRALSETVRLFQDEYDLDVTGRIDRDTYETLMRNYDQALGVVDHGAQEDDFYFLHTSQALGDSEGLTEHNEEAQGLDADDPGLLNLDQDTDAGLDPQELEDL